MAPRDETMKIFLENYNFIRKNAIIFMKKLFKILNKIW